MNGQKDCLKRQVCGPSKYLNLTTLYQIVKGEPWSDFQLLTSSIRTVTEARQAFWMNPNALRIRTTRLQGVYLGPRALEAIRADYLVCSDHAAQRTQKLKVRHRSLFLCPRSSRKLQLR